LAQNCHINLGILNELLLKPNLEWLSFSNEEFKSTIIKCNDSSTPGLDYISWKYFKAVTKDKKYLINIINIVNVCINISHWSSHFKMSLSIIIPKSNKVAYDSPKAFCSIILLNTLEKLIKRL